MPRARPFLWELRAVSVALRRMVLAHDPTGGLHRRILLALPVILRLFVEIVGALAVLALRTRANSRPSHPSGPLPANI
jgi:hypothetical protein